MSTLELVSHIFSAYHGILNPPGLLGGVVLAYSGMYGVIPLVPISKADGIREQYLFNIAAHEYYYISQVDKS